MERSVSPQGTAADQRQPSLPRRVNKRAVSRGALTAATTALLGCAGSLPSARAAGAAVSGAPSGPRPTGARALRRSNWSTRGHGSEYRSLLDVAGQQRRGLSSLSRAWGAAQSTRGGAFSRRGGNGPAAAVPAAGMGGDEGEEAREDVVSGEGGGGGGGDDADAEAASGQGSDEVSDGGIERQDPAGDAGDAGGSDGDDGYGHGAGESDSFSEEQEPGEGGDEEGEEEEEEEEEGERVQEGHAEEGEGGGSSQDVGEEGGSGAALSEKRRPVAPLFSFPPGPRVDRTEAEESLQEVLPMQQRLVKYLTEDKVFGAQILCSAYFLISAVAYSMDSVKFGGCYQAALTSLTIKQWGTVLGRVRRVLVPHLLYEPQRYVKYRARVSALALDPAVQGIVYCGIFMFMPLKNALLPLLLRESVYLLWVVKEVLQIAAPVLVGAVISFLEPLMSVLMTAGDTDMWRNTPEAQKRMLLGRRLAQVCFKLELVMPFSIALRILPGAIQASLGGAQVAAEGAGGVVAGSEGIRGQVTRILPLLKVGTLLMAYVKLLTVRNAQLEDDVRILRGLKIRGYNCEWVEQAADSVVFGYMVGCPWWVGLLASGFALLPNHEATKAVMSSENKLQTLGMSLLNLAIGRTPGAEDDEHEDEEGGGGDGSDTVDGEEAPPPTKMAKLAKVAAVATGISDF
eukprot:jgi/Undpi1/12269/HiC_scaffold_5.g01945.m1